MLPGPLLRVPNKEPMKSDNIWINWHPEATFFYVSERDFLSVKDSIIYDSETGSIGQSLTHKKACLRTDIVPVSPGKWSISPYRAIAFSTKWAASVLSKKVFHDGMYSTNEK